MDKWQQALSQERSSLNEKSLDAQADVAEPNTQFPGGISGRIVDIIKKRQDLANHVKPVHQHLSRLHEEIVNLEHRRQQLVQAIDDLEVDRKLEEINFDALKKKIEQDLRELDKLIGRFSRGTLNVGVVGRMGQGKSTFLKSLSGLTDNEIPAREGGACTAVRSKIFHHDGDTEATVVYHSKNTFLEEVIGEYYRELELGSVGSLEEFAHSSLPNSPRSATHEEMYKRLRDDYHSTYKMYRDCLGDSIREQTIGKNEIPKYVAQQRDSQRRLTSFEHLAVREVKINCRFPKVEVHKLGLVDVPGLGDTRVADEKLILKTLEQEVDVVLFFRKPDFDRYQWEKDDFKLYDIAATALDSLKSRAFMVLNHRKYGDKDNLNGCNELKNNTQSIRVVDSPVIADCSNPEDANQVLDLVLKYLDKNIIQIEEQYARSCQNRLFEVHNSINLELEKAQIALVSYVGESRQFESKFKETIDALAESLNNMLEDLWKQHETIDSDFESIVKGALQKCENDTGIPSEEEIKRLTRLPKYKNRYEVVHRVCAAELRSHLSKNFLSLEQGLLDASDKLKRLISETLIDEGSLGELARSLNVRDIEFLEMLRKMLNLRQNRLELGFKTLLDFKMSYGALIMESIRRDLDQVIGGVRSSSQPEASPSSVIKAGSEIVGDVSRAASQLKTDLPSLEKIQAGLEIAGNVASAVTSKFEISDASSVQKSLKELHKKAVDQCKQTLDQWIKAPSRLRYYMAEEFVDRVLYDEDMEEEWRHFLSDPDIRSKVWIEFKQIEDRKQVQADWLSTVRRVQELNQRKLLTFIS